MNAPAGDSTGGPGDPADSGGPGLDHPIFTESIRLIHGWLGDTGLEINEQDVLERLVHSGGDLSLASELRFSPGACAAGIDALRAGAPILTDTAMAAAAVAPMARRTYANPVHSLLEWAPAVAPPTGTRTAAALAHSAFSVRATNTSYVTRRPPSPNASATRATSRPACVFF